MVYRGYPQRNRRYLGTPMNYAQENQETSNKINELNDIPLPNEVEVPLEKNARAYHSNNNSFLNNFKLPFLDSFNLRFKLDDIVLLGIIFILLNDNPDDDFLVIILLYIFFAGREI